MNELFWVLHIGAETHCDGSGEWLPEELKPLNEAMWRVTPFGRWEHVSRAVVLATPERARSAVERAKAIVLWLSPDYGDTPSVFRKVLDLRPKAPVVLVAAQTIWSTRRGTGAIESEFAAARVIEASKLDGDDDASRRTAVEGFLNLLPRREKLAPWDRSKYPQIGELAVKYGEERLERAVQAYFPFDPNPEIKPVGGGWSGDPLLKVKAKGGNASRRRACFLKFFNSKDEYERELRKNLRADRWLSSGDTKAGVRTCWIPKLGEPEESQAEAFPPTKSRAMFVVCYDSAADRPERKTLKDLFAKSRGGKKSGAAVSTGLGLLLRVLAKQDAVSTSEEAPWTRADDLSSVAVKKQFWGAPKRSAFPFHLSMRVTILDTLRDLKPYGSAAFEQDWASIEEKLTALATDTDLPAWLSTKTQVQRGCTHGDPNPRNCLVKADGSGLKLIDCGDFDDGWRLVSDLAVIEREVKLVLLGCDLAGPPFRDLEVRLLKMWAAAEAAAARDRLGLPATRHASTTYAYELIGKVRARAGEVSEGIDAEGRHYFAALLWWTLDILKEPAVRRTKKLLALYSAWSILERFK